MYYATFFQIDREYCVVQSEFYFDEPKQRGHAAQFNAQRRTPTAYYLNGHEGTNTMLQTIFLSSAYIGRDMFHSYYNCLRF